MKETILKLEGISKGFDGTGILDDLNLEIGQNEFVTLLGPSGCGKTTTLRIIGGFEKPETGRVIFKGTDITNFSPDKRNINTVFQKYSLFSHMNVEENIAFGLKLKKIDKEAIVKKVEFALELVDLKGYGKRKPESLSGGQQQRIAIARAIVNEPDILLLDEPLGALDLKLRHDMQQELIKIKNELGITFIYVTHDQEEALTMSDRIVVMNQGYIQQIGTPEDIYNEPQNAFVADFIGDSNIFDGTMLEDKVVEIFGKKVECVDVGFEKNEKVDVVLRPEDMELVGPEKAIFNGVVESVLFKGVHYEMKVKTENFTFLVHSTVFEEVGTKVGLYVLPFNIQIMHKPASEDEEVIKKDE